MNKKKSNTFCVMNEKSCNVIEFLLGDVVGEVLSDKSSVFNLKVINLLQYDYNDIGTLDIWVGDVLKESIQLAANVIIPFDFMISTNNIKFSIYLSIKIQCKKLIFQIIFK